jgi:hypothetical protein
MFIVGKLPGRLFVGRSLYGRSVATRNDSSCCVLLSIERDT